MFLFLVNIYEIVVHFSFFWPLMMILIWIGITWIVCFWIFLLLV